MQEEDVTNEWLSELLGDEIGSISRERIGDGLVGMNLRVVLADHAPELPDSVVLKLPSTDETSRMTGIMLRNYEREVKFYLQLADTVDIRVPHCHHGSWDEASGDFVLVLEDMTPAAEGNQITGCDVATARIAVAELARLHGPRLERPDARRRRLAHPPHRTSGRAGTPGPVRDGLSAVHRDLPPVPQ